MGRMDVRSFLIRTSRLGEPPRATPGVGRYPCMHRFRRLAPLLLTALVFALLAAPAGASSPLLAPPSACPNQDTLGAPAAVQEEAMLCMTDYARERFGEPPLQTQPQLQASAADKSGDVLRCDSFSHTACGREFTYWMRATGYVVDNSCWRVGENLAWGTGAKGSVGSIFRAWMRSTTHRENVLGDFDQVGISLDSGTLTGSPGTRVWTQHFGSHCE